MFHLVSRFFGFLTAQPLRPRDQLFVSHALPSDLRRLFYAQRTEDQRHAITVAMRVGNRPHLIEAALMHDVGKTAIQLGAFGRALATVWAFTSLPIWGQWLTYVDHGPIGAELLEAHGAGDLAITFARYHPGDRHAPFVPADWSALEQADTA